MNLNSKQILAKMCSNTYTSLLTMKNTDVLIDIAKIEGKIETLSGIKPATSRTSSALAEAIMNRDKLIKNSGLLTIL